MRVLSMIVMAIFLAAMPALAVDFYVDKDSIGGPCSNSNEGVEITAPWCSIGTANVSSGAGDTVHIRAGTYNETIAPNSSGQSDSERLIFTNYQDELVVISGVGTAVNLIDKEYISIDGIDIELVNRYVTLDNSHHIEISNGTFDDHNSPEGWPVGIVFRNDSHHNWLHDCLVARSGYSTADDDKGAVFNLGSWEDSGDDSDHNLIEDNVFFYGGHHVMEVSASYNVVRNNYFHNENWMDCTRVETGNLCGNRGMIFEYYADNVQYNVIEGNRFAFSGTPPDQITSTGLSLRTPHNIVRRNMFYYCDGAGMSISSSDGEWDPSDNHVYHNVFYHNGYPALGIVEDRNKTGLIVEHHGNGVEVVDQAIKNNIFYDNQLHAIFFYYVDADLQVVEGNWEEAGDPGFVDIVSPVEAFDPSKPDFNLVHGSDCIDAGVFLTRTVGAGSGLDLPVEDAGYFSDGREAVAADQIQLEGEVGRVRIVSIDYAQNILHLQTAISWQAGQGVSLPFEGSLPDMGAFEFTDLGTCLEQSGSCCSAAQVCQGGDLVSASDCPGLCCVNGGSCQDTPPTCQNQGFMCCELCLAGGAHPEYSSDCGNEECCEECDQPSFDVDECVAAEAGELVAPMSLLTDAAAAGGTYIASSSSNSGSAAFWFDVPSSGLYVLMAKVMTPGPDQGAHDSFYVGRDREVIVSDDHVYGVTHSDGYAWDQVRRVSSGDPTEWNLSEGPHVFWFYGRESGTRLDQVMLKSCPSAGNCPAAASVVCPVCPDGTCDPGENCGNCSADCLSGGQVCCGGETFDGNCCGNGDCQPGEACADHLCVQAESVEEDGGLDGGADPGIDGGGDVSASDEGSSGSPKGSCGCANQSNTFEGWWVLLVVAAGLVLRRRRG
jgi:parallel beta helix pectate lyase-like protein